MAKAKYVYIIVNNGMGDADFRNLCQIVGIHNYSYVIGVFKAWVYDDKKISKLTSILDILDCSYDVAYSKEKEDSIQR